MSGLMFLMLVGAYFTTGWILLATGVTGIVFVDQDDEIARFPTMVATGLFWLPLLAYELYLRMVR